MTEWRTLPDGWFNAFQIAAEEAIATGRPVRVEGYEPFVMVPDLAVTEMVANGYQLPDGAPHMTRYGRTVYWFHAGDHPTPSTD